MAGFREIAEQPARLYAVGDVHACSKELSVLINHLTTAEKLAQNDLVVFIGDYIDRGPDARGVIEQLMAFKSLYPKSVFLRGNHEEMFLSFLGLGGSQGEVYIDNGGGETLISYGIDPELAAESVVELIPKDHLDFMLAAERYVVVGDFIFVHAGLNPLRGLTTQIDDDIYWIRDSFINNIHHFGKTVVFGHTPYEDLLVHLPFKIGIDTGLVYGNMLSCVDLTGQRVLQIGPEETQVRIKKFS